MKTERTGREVGLSLDELDVDTWREVAPSFADYNYRHIWEYGVACAQRHGATTEHVAIRSGNDIIGVADVRIKRVPFLGTAIAYISGGPLSCPLSSEANIDSLYQCVQKLAEEYVHRRGCVLRVQCPVGFEEWNMAAKRCLEEFGFVCATGLRQYRTILVDTSASLDVIRSRFSSNWRKNLQRGEKRGVTITDSTDISSFKVVKELFGELVRRKGISVDLGATFYEELQTSVSYSDRLTVILAEVEGRPAGMLVVSILGDMVTGLIGATTRVGAINYASYVMYWRAIELASTLGKKAFDLAGIDPEANPNVYNFKMGFRGTEVTAAGPMQLAPSSLRSRLLLRGERCYRVFFQWADWLAKGKNTG